MFAHYLPSFRHGATYAPLLVNKAWRGAALGPPTFGYTSGLEIDILLALLITSQSRSLARMVKKIRQVPAQGQIGHCGYSLTILGQRGKICVGSASC